MHLLPSSGEDGRKALVVLEYMRSSNASGRTMRARPQDPIQICVASRNKGGRKARGNNCPSLRSTTLMQSCEDDVYLWLVVRRICNRTLFTIVDAFPRYQKSFPNWVDSIIYSADSEETSTWNYDSFPLQQSFLRRGLMQSPSKQHRMAGLRRSQYLMAGGIVDRYKAVSSQTAKGDICR